jgi:uncharacterized membrane protein YcfT
MASSETIRYLSQLSGGAASAWFVAWVIRRRGEFDVRLTKLEQFVRWMVVAVCVPLTLLPGARLAILRLLAGLVGIAFVAWPNLAHHLAVLLHLPSEADQE